MSYQRNDNSGNKPPVFDRLGPIRSHTSSEKRFPSRLLPVSNNRLRIVSNTDTDTNHSAEYTPKYNEYPYQYTGISGILDDRPSYHPSSPNIPYHTTQPAPSMPSMDRSNFNFIRYAEEQPRHKRNYSFVSQSKQQRSSSPSAVPPPSSVRSPYSEHESRPPISMLSSHRTENTDYHGIGRTIQQMEDNQPPSDNSPVSYASPFSSNRDKLAHNILIVKSRVQESMSRSVMDSSNEINTKPLDGNSREISISVPTPRENNGPPHNMTKEKKGIPGSSNHLDPFSKSRSAQNDKDASRGVQSSDVDRQRRIRSPTDTSSNKQNGIITLSDKSKEAATKSSTHKRISPTNSSQVKGSIHTYTSVHLSQEGAVYKNDVDTRSDTKSSRAFSTSSERLDSDRSSMSSKIISSSTKVHLDPFISRKKMEPTKVSTHSVSEQVKKQSIGKTPDTSSTSRDSSNKLLLQKTKGTQSSSTSLIAKTKEAVASNIIRNAQLLNMNAQNSRKAGQTTTQTQRRTFQPPISESDIVSPTNQSNPNQSNAASPANQSNIVSPAKLSSALPPANQSITVPPAKQSNTVSSAKVSSSAFPANQSNTLSPIKVSRTASPANQSNASSPTNQSNTSSSATPSNTVTPADQTNTIKSNTISSSQQPNTVSPASQSDTVSPATQSNPIRSPVIQFSVKNGKKTDLVLKIAKARAKLLPIDKRDDVVMDIPLMQDEEMSEASATSRKRKSSAELATSPHKQKRSDTFDPMNIDLPIPLTEQVEKVEPKTPLAVVTPALIPVEPSTNTLNNTSDDTLTDSITVNFNNDTADRLKNDMDTTDADTHTDSIQMNIIDSYNMIEISGQEASDIIDTRTTACYNELKEALIGVVQRLKYSIMLPADSDEVSLSVTNTPLTENNTINPDNDNTILYANITYGPTPSDLHLPLNLTENAPLQPPIVPSTVTVSEWNNKDVHSGDEPIKDTASITSSINQDEEEEGSSSPSTPSENMNPNNETAPEKKTANNNNSRRLPEPWRVVMTETGDISYVNIKTMETRSMRPTF
ncbi:hypothetical protein BDB01DRAFT_833395 [Pilobolus umbonatus]|nr:hypothetical protein BDB01DRAFT_833395 [Pilobolus umbonatus]